MRPLLRPLLIALALHLVTALVLVAIRLPLPAPGIAPELTLMPSLPEHAPSPPRRARGQALPLPPQVTLRSEHEAAQWPDTVRPPTPALPRAADLLRGATDSLRAQAIRRWTLFRQPLPDSLLLPTPSELLMQRLARYGPAPGELGGVPTRDFAADDLYKRATGHGKLADLGSVLQRLGLGRATPAPPTRITQEPTTQELRVLQQLWAAGSASAPELYRQLDPALVPSAEWLDHLLDQMTERGLVRRRLISPQDLLTVTTPLGTMEVERNQLNRLNRVYRYWPVVSREAVLHYLQGALLEQSASDSTSQARRRLTEKLLMLVEQP